MEEDRRPCDLNEAVFEDKVNLTELKDKLSGQSMPNGFTIIQQQQQQQQRSLILVKNLAMSDHAFACLVAMKCCSDKNHFNFEWLVRNRFIVFKNLLLH